MILKPCSIQAAGHTSRITGLRRQIGQDQPGVFVAVFPAGQQGAGHLVPRKGQARAAPTRPGPRDEGHQGPPAHRPSGPKAATRVDPQKRMPTQARDAPKQPGRIQAAIGQHDHRPTLGDRWAQPPQQPQPFTPPGVFGARRQDHPGTGMAQPRYTTLTASTTKRCPRSSHQWPEPIGCPATSSRPNPAGGQSRSPHAALGAWRPACVGHQNTTRAAAGEPSAPCAASQLASS